MTTPRDVLVAVVSFAALALYAWYLDWRERRLLRASPEAARAAALCDLLCDAENGVRQVRVHHTDEAMLAAVDREAARRRLVARGAYSAALGVGRVTITRA
jgi:hypothetical protein